MNLGDLIDELRVNILNDRSDQIDGDDDDRLWSDKTLTRYINEAQRRFAMKSFCLRSKLTVVTIAGTREYALPVGIMGVLSAKFGTEHADLARAGHSVLNAYQSPTNTFIDQRTYAGLPDGKPLAFSTDEEISIDEGGSVNAVTLSLYPTPTTSFGSVPIELRVIRLPTPLEQGDVNAIPEIPEEHHLNMLDWAAYLALRIVDQDEENRTRAADFRTSFEQHAKDALRETMRKVFVPTQWAFGRGGFSWVK